MIGSVFLHPRPSSVTELVADGHVKAHVKCENVVRHAGKPRGSGKIKPHSHGWFMIVNPKDQRILWAKAMDKPEGNGILEEAVTDILPHYRKAGGLVIDRACSFLRRMQQLRALKRIKFLSVDFFMHTRIQRIAPATPCTG